MFWCVSGRSVQDSDATDASAWVHTSPTEICETGTHAQAVCQSLQECSAQRVCSGLPPCQGCPGGALGAALGMEELFFPFSSLFSSPSSFSIPLSGAAGCTSTAFQVQKSLLHQTFPVTQSCSIFSTNKSPVDIPFVTACSPAPSSIDSSLFQM